MQNRLCGVVCFAPPYLEKSVCQCCVFVAVDCLFVSVIDFVVVLYLFVWLFV